MQIISKNEIKKYVTQNYSYNLENDLKSLQETNTFNGTSEVTVPQSIFIFLISNSFENSIRNAISIGGDAYTIAYKLKRNNEQIKHFFYNKGCPI